MKKPKIVIASGKRKCAIARAKITEGKGRWRINSMPVELIPNEVLRFKVMEPILLAKDIVPIETVDIDVEVSGGGVMGQANAARTAIAKGLVEYFKNEKLERVFNEFDQWMLKNDPRQTLPHHGPTRSHKGPRARRQTSYR